MFYFAGWDEFLTEFDNYLWLTFVDKIEDPIIDRKRHIDNIKSSTRSKIGHAFCLIKVKFELTKVLVFLAVKTLLFCFEKIIL